MPSEKKHIETSQRDTDDTRKPAATTMDQSPMVSGLPLRGSTESYERARQVLPGGTTRVTVKRTPVPIYINRGQGAYLFDIDGNRYLDLFGNYTALVHGHSFPPVVEALKQQLDAGTCFANPTESEIALAELLVARVPSVDKIRFTNSGTEAMLFAVEAARAFTGRTKIAKLEGAYHGAYDWAEVSEASTPDNWGDKEPAYTPFYAGTPDSVLNETVVIPINDIATSTQLIERHAPDLACILIDLMPSRAGLLMLSPDYLERLSDLARRYEILLKLSSCTDNNPATREIRSRTISCGTPS